VSGLAAYFTGQPFLFPSLGPTAFLFFEQPMAEMSSPRNTLIGHLVAVLAGALSLAVFGLLDDPSILVEGVTLARALAGRSHWRSRGRSCSCSGLRTRRRARRRSS
jgi:predicted short-subunit dehydrogenase-like oxidoreductase (DUF2520 family)